MTEADDNGDDEMLARLSSLRLFREAHFEQCHGRRSPESAQHTSAAPSNKNGGSSNKDGQQQQQQRSLWLGDEQPLYDTPFQLHNFVLAANCSVHPVQHGDPQLATDAPPLCATAENVQEARQLRLIIPASTREQLEVKPTLRRSRDGDRSSMNIYQHLPLFHFRLHTSSSQRVAGPRGGYDTTQTLDIRRHCVGDCRR